MKRVIIRLLHGRSVNRALELALQLDAAGDTRGALCLASLAAAALAGDSRAARLCGLVARRAS